VSAVHGGDQCRPRVIDGMLGSSSYICRVLNLRSSSFLQPLRATSSYSQDGMVNVTDVDASRMDTALLVLRRYSKTLKLGTSLMRRSDIGSYHLFAPSLHDIIASVDILLIWDVERNLLL
jgi:hypothetical protein